MLRRQCTSIRAEDADDDKEPVSAVGDVVIVHSRFDELDYVVLERGGHFQNRYGLFAHDDILGQRLGRRWVSTSQRVASGAGFVLALQPSPELWSLSLAHRTQIVYVHDIAVLCMEMELRPGSIVVEAGTGSGSMTASLARAVSPGGRVLSFEFHEQRVQRARQDFERLGLAEAVTVTQRDVTASASSGDGSSRKALYDVPDGSVDAVFLDLPAVWDVLAEAHRVLRADGVLATFSPCIEQVQQTVSAIREQHAFCELKVLTVGARSWDTHERAANYGNVPAEVSRRKRHRQELEPERDAVDGSNGAVRKMGNAVGERRGIPDKKEEIERKTKPVVTRPFRESGTHTAYLSFARKVVDGDDFADYVELDEEDIIVEDGGEAAEEHDAPPDINSTMKETDDELTRTTIPGD